MSQVDLHVWLHEVEQGRLSVLVWLRERLWLVCHLRHKKSVVTCLDFALCVPRLNNCRRLNLFCASRCPLLIFFAHPSFHHDDGYRGFDHSGGQLCLHLCQREPGWNGKPRIQPGQEVPLPPQASSHHGVRGPAGDPGPRFPDGLRGAAHRQTSLPGVPGLRQSVQRPLPPVEGHRGVQYGRGPRQSQEGEQHLESLHGAWSQVLLPLPARERHHKDKGETPERWG